MKNIVFSFIFLSTLLLFSFQSKAQSQIEVSGQVKDLETKETLPYCKVVAINAADSIVSGGITDDKGFFKLPLDRGQYKLVISFYGYLNDTIQTEPLRADHFLGVFKLEANSLELDEMNVEASARIDLLDRDIHIITEDQKKGSTAAKDVLNKVAGVTYDDYSGTLKIDSDANIMILVNGVEKSQEYIQNLAPERLLKVEITRDPGGRYGLEGYTAILNVVLRRDYKGTELYLEQMNLVDINREHEKLDYMIGSINGTFNYTNNNLNLYAGAWVERRLFVLDMNNRIEYDDNYAINETGEWRTQNSSLLKYKAEYLLGFDYRINPKHMISFESSTSALPRNTDINTFEYKTEVYSNDTLLEAYDFDMRTKNQAINTYNTLFYIADFNERNKLNVNLTYSYYRNDYTTNSEQEGYYTRSETGVDKKQYTRFYAEFDHIISAKTNLQIGYGNTWRELKNTFNVNQIDIPSAQEDNFISDFLLSDMRHKLYTNFSWKISPKWGMRIGVGAETSSPRVSGQQLNYLTFQPMFDLRYVPSKLINIKLKYRTSTSYPSISETNPFVSQLSPRMTSTGNPFLRPSLTHRFSLRINALHGIISLEPYMHFSNNRIAQVGELAANGIFNFRYENVKSYTRSGVKLNFSHYFKFSLLVQGNIEVFHTEIKSSSRINNFMDWQADADLIYIFPKSEILLGLKYQRQQTKMITGLGYQKGEVDFWMLFYKQPLFKKRASIMFGYFLPLDFGANYNQDTQVENTGFRSQSNVDVSLIKNMFILEFSFRFSKGKTVKKNKKDVKQENEDSGGGLF